jgi:hypothetical protein
MVDCLTWCNSVSKWWGGDVEIDVHGPWPQRSHLITFLHNMPCGHAFIQLYRGPFKANSWRLLCILLVKELCLCMTAYKKFIRFKSGTILKLEREYWLLVGKIRRNIWCRSASYLNNSWLKRAFIIDVLFFSSFFLNNNSRD